MTLEDVAQAKHALEAEGTYPSYDAVRAKLGHGSKRDVTRLMQHLANVGIPLADPGGTDALSLEVRPADTVPVGMVPADTLPPVPELARSYDAWQAAQARSGARGTMVTPSKRA